MNLWLFVIDQGTGISLPTGTSLDGVPIFELVPYSAIFWSAWQEFECTNFLNGQPFYLSTYFLILQKLIELLDLLELFKSYEFFSYYSQKYQIQQILQDRAYFDLLNFFSLRIRSSTDI